MWYDEDFMVPNKHSDVLNKALEPYAHESVYLCSNLSGTNLLQYTSPTHRNLPIKVLFVPWTILTAVAQMTMAAKKFIGPEQQSSIQFGCFHNRPDTHKQQLIAALLHRQLSSIGHIVMDGKPLNQSCQLVLPFADTIDRLYWTSSHDMKKCFAFDQATQTMLGQWFVSQQRLNVMISDIPLIIGADTTLGIFPISDKLYWPVIAGRMLMLHSRAYMYQEFKNLTGFDCGSYLDLEFDGIEGWDQSAHSARLECMLDKNLYVIKHARDKWPEVAPQLQHLASNFANMIYQHFCDGLDQIQ